MNLDSSIPEVKPNQTLLDRKKCSYFRLKLIKQHIFKPNCDCRKKSVQEKKFVMVVRFELKIPSLRIIVWHHLASLVMLDGYPRDGIFNPNCMSFILIVFYWLGCCITTCIRNFSSQFSCWLFNICFDTNTLNSVYVPSFIIFNPNSHIAFSL